MDGSHSVYREEESEKNPKAILFALDYYDTNMTKADEHSDDKFIEMDEENKVGIQEPHKVILVA